MTSKVIIIKYLCALFSHHHGIYECAVAYRIKAEELQYKLATTTIVLFSFINVIIICCCCSLPKAKTKNKKKTTCYYGGIKIMTFFFCAACFVLLLMVVFLELLDVGNFQVQKFVFLFFFSIFFCVTKENFPGYRIAAATTAPRISLQTTEILWKSNGSFCGKVANRVA